MTATTAPAAQLVRSTVRTVWVVARCLATVAAVGLTAGLAALTALPQMGGRGLVVTSGSMEPGIAAGDLVIVAEAEPRAITTGDVITYASLTGHGLTTHRVVSVHRVKGRLHFKTQGDHNDSPDVDLAPAANVIGTVRHRIPQGGYLISSLASPRLRLIAVGGPALWLALRNFAALRAALRRPDVTPRPRRDRRRYSVAVAFVVMMAAGSAPTSAPRVTNAVLTGATAIGDNTFSSGTWT